MPLSAKTRPDTRHCITGAVPTASEGVARVKGQRLTKCNKTDTISLRSLISSSDVAEKRKVHENSCNEKWKASSK